MNLRTWKTIKAGLVTLALFLFGVFAITQGADPTTTFTLTAIVAALLNGVEFAELAAAMAQVNNEEQAESDDA